MSRLVHVPQLATSLLVLLLLGASLLAGLAGCAEPDVVLVLFDTLRKDHVGTYGYDRDTTPAIDAIAREGLVFENVVSQSSWTRRSVAGLSTSKYHSYFRPELYDTDNDDDGSQLTDTLRDEALTLAEIFASNGYRTASVTTNLNLPALFNLNQGFEEESFQTSAPADWVVDRALETIDSDDSEDRRPLFLYLHFMEPHAPLEPPEPYASMFPTLDGNPHERAHTHHFLYSDYATPSKLQTHWCPIFRSHVFALYDGKVEDRLALSETRTRWTRQRSIQDAEFQYVVLDDDREPLFDRRDGRVAGAAGRGPGSPEAAAPLDPWMCRGLAELGYVELERCAPEE